MAHRVREGRLVPVQDGERQPVALKGPAQQVLAHLVGVEFAPGVDGHHVAHELQVAERHARLDGVDRDAPVGPEHVVHVQLADALFRLPLEGFRVGREVRVLVAEEFIGNFAGHQHPDVGVFVDVLAHQVHADGRADGGDVVGAQKLHHMGQRLQHVLRGDDHVGVVALKVIGHHAGVLEVDGVLRHADGKGADGLIQKPCRDRADQRTVKAAAQEETQRRVGVHPLLNARHEPRTDAFADGFHVAIEVLLGLGDIRIAGDFAIHRVAAGREGQDGFRKAHQVLGFAGVDQRAVGEAAVVQRADADRIPGGDQHVFFGIVQDQRELRVEVFEHVQPLFAVERQKKLAVGLALKLIPPGKRLLDWAEAVQFAVAYHHVAVQRERLHAGFRQAHDGQAVEAKPALSCLLHARHVRPAGRAAGKRLQHLVERNAPLLKPHD